MTDIPHDTDRHARRQRRLTRLVVALIALMASLVAAASPARADDAGIATSYTVEGTVAKDGGLTVRETIAWTGGDNPPASLTQRLATRYDQLDNAYYEYTISGLKASSGGRDLGAKVSTDGTYQVITVDTSKLSGKTLTISYSVRGAATKDAEVKGRKAHTTIVWRVLQGLSVPVREASGTVKMPGLIDRYSCQSGAPVAPSACRLSQGGAGGQLDPVFTDGPRGAGEMVEMTIGISSTQVSPDAVLKHEWTLDRAFSASPAALLSALAALLLGGFLVWLLHRRGGRDLEGSGEPSRIAEFSPVGPGEEEFSLLAPVRPGEVGTIADERVDPVDVTATLLDLAVRGHLIIHELPRENPHAPIDWSFERVEGEDELRDYERLLLDAVAPRRGEDQVKVSEISEAIGPVIPEVEDALYDEVVREGWFERRPDATRNRWNAMGVGAVVVAAVAAALLVAFTTLGLLGLALLAVAVALLVVGQQMPRRTARGSDVLAGLHLLAGELMYHRTDQMPPARAYEELSQILPYAVVLGGRERWLDALAAADDDIGTPDPEDLTWYHAPDTWDMQDLPVSMGAFVTTVQGRLFGR